MSTKSQMKIDGILQGERKAVDDRQCQYKAHHQDDFGMRPASQINTGRHLQKGTHHQHSSQPPTNLFTIGMSDGRNQLQKSTNSTKRYLPTHAVTWRRNDRAESTMIPHRPTSSSCTYLDPPNGPESGWGHTLGPNNEFQTNDQVTWPARWQTIEPSIPQQIECGRSWLSV